MSCLPDLAHSEYYNLVGKLYLLLNSKVLMKRAAAKFATMFYSFMFSSGWGQIQSSCHAYVILKYEQVLMRFHYCIYATLLLAKKSLYMLFL